MLWPGHTRTIGDNRRKTNNINRNRPASSSGPFGGVLGQRIHDVTYICFVFSTVGRLHCRLQICKAYGRMVCIHFFSARPFCLTPYSKESSTIPNDYKKALRQGLHNLKLSISWVKYSDEIVFFSGPPGRQVLQLQCEHPRAFHGNRNCNKKPLANDRSPDERFKYHTIIS